MSALKFIGFAIALIVVATTAMAADWVAAILNRDNGKAPGARGIASWYGEGYRGKTMANGQPFDPDALTCAAWGWPLGTVLRVRQVGQMAAVRVTVTDRGPDRRLDRLIDLSRAAFARIAPLDRGLAEVEVVEERAMP